jgi:PAS domain S-box-containing protein
MPPNNHLARVPFSLLNTISSTQLFQQMFDKADMGMALADVTTRRFLRVNAKLCEITGYSEQELLNTTAVALTHPDDRASDQESFERFAHGETDRRVAEKRYVRGDGTSVWVRITTVIIQISDARCSFGITEDITARRAAFAALEGVERRTNQFLAMLGHELRNPLAAIRNCSEVLQSISSDDDRLTRVQRVIDRQSHNLERLVNDLLDSARVATGKITLNKSYVALSEVINEAVETIEQDLAARHHELTLSLPQQEIYVLADHLRLVQIVTNILTNAVKYTPDRGRIDIHASIDERYVDIVITDTGIGIPADELPNIFKLFEQAGRSPDGTAGGLGIGLAITKRLVELHDGEIHVRSHPGLGSTFRICLPHENRRVQPAMREPQAVPSHSRILIVEDNADVADTMAMVLTEKGHDVRIAPHGKAALDVADTWPCDVFLIDIGLPDISGYDLVKQLRERHCSKSAYMIAVSGHAQRSAIEHSLHAGFDRHLVKPVDFESLTALLNADRRGRS